MRRPGPSRDPGRSRSRFGGGGPRDDGRLGWWDAALRTLDPLTGQAMCHRPSRGPLRRGAVAGARFPRWVRIRRARRDPVPSRFAIPRVPGCTTGCAGAARSPTRSPSSLTARRPIHTLSLRVEVRTILRGRLEPAVRPTLRVPGRANLPDRPGFAEPFRSRTAYRSHHTRKPPRFTAAPSRDRRCRRGHHPNPLLPGQRTATRPAPTALRRPPGTRPSVFGR